MTEFIHEPVLLEEVLSALQPAAGRLYVDGTVGGGGHAEAILEVTGPDGRLVAFDRDDWALKAAVRRLARFGDRLELHWEPFASLTKRLGELCLHVGPRMGRKFAPTFRGFPRCPRGGIGRRA